MTQDSDRENPGFSADQQEYLKGFMAGVEARRAVSGQPLAPQGSGAASEPAAEDPADPQRAAQNRVLAAGGKLVPEEEAKRRTPPFDRYDAFTRLAAQGVFPKGTDVFLTKFHGLFYVAPAQNAFMCRLRIPGGILTAHQLQGVAAIADDLAGGYADITTRANLQLREIPATAAPELLMRLAELGLTSRGSGADNVRNITGSPTAGIDPQELIDTRPHARALHYHILNTRALYGLPRKFNIALDGGGAVPVLEDTNDIAFTATTHDGAVVYRLALGGITGHQDFARETGIVVAPDDTVPVCDAILRVFIAHGTRTDRTKARLKYLLDAWGLPKFLNAVEAELGRGLTRVDAATLPPRAPQDRLGHIGVHAQKQAGQHYIGVVCPVGRLSSDRLRGLADVAQCYGSGTLRLTVWQNLLISDIPTENLAQAEAAIAGLGLATEAGPLRAGLVACTGSAGCKFAAGDTKGHAARLVDWLESRIHIDQPINIHLTGCHHSCAQHYIADIGLLAVKIDRDDEMVEGYALHVGGGAGAQAAIGRLVRPGIVFDDLPAALLALLTAWQRDRTPDEHFQAWTARMTDDALRDICAPEMIGAA